jgi:hypothetical protein
MRNYIKHKGSGVKFKNSTVTFILKEECSFKEFSQELNIHANSLYYSTQEIEKYR